MKKTLHNVSIKKMKLIFSIAILLLFTLNLSAQNTNTHKTLFLVNNHDNIMPFLENEYGLKQKQISLKNIYEIESLTGKHITYSCNYNNIELKDFFIKIHINKQNQIYFIQENISELGEITIIEREFNTELINRNIGDRFTIFKQKEMYFLNSNNIFERVFQLDIYNENLDIYLERIYKNDIDFIDKDLKIFYHPVDTTIKGSVFLPDPLTSAEQIYGNNYQDSFKKDTSVIVLDTIQNVGQATISTLTIPFTFHGESGNISAQNIANTFAGSNVYLVFQDLYLDGNPTNIGYNTYFTDNLTGLQTEIIQEDYNYFELNAEQFNIEVLGDYSNSNFNLKNTFFEITQFSPPVIIPYSSAVNNFTFGRQNSSFEEINAFYHLNNFHNYIESLGFKNLDPQKIKIDVHANNGADNSYFTHLPTVRLAFGDGGVDDGEDASVVIHEYAHALSYFASPNTNDGAERQALDEALGDYFASSYISQYGNFTSGQVFPWDGHNEFWDGRISNSDSTYDSYNATKSIYFNAQILSATLMDIFHKIGKEKTDILVLEAMFFNTKNNTFKDFTEILRQVDNEIFNFIDRIEIDRILVKRKFLEKTSENDDGYIIQLTEDFLKGGKAEIYVIEDDFEKMDVWISNSLGKIVYKEKNINSTKIVIDSKNLYRGIYYVRIQTTNNKYKTKLLKP